MNDDRMFLTLVSVVYLLLGETINKMSFESPVYSIQDLYKRNNESPDFFSQFNSARSFARKRPQRSSSLPNETLHPYYSLRSGRRNTLTGSAHGVKGNPGLTWGLGQGLSITKFYSKESYCLLSRSYPRANLCDADSSK